MQSSFHCHVSVVTGCFSIFQLICYFHQVLALCAQARIYFSDIQSHISDLAKIVPSNQYYKYNSLWSGPMQQACFLATLIMYLEHERLITVDELEGFFAGKE